MNLILSSIVAPLLVATAICVAAADPAAAQTSCMSNRQLQAAIASGTIAPVAQVLANAGISRDTQVLSLQVCQDKSGTWSYYVGILDPQGQASTLVLQASG
jgi:hypothetical protein